MGAVRTVWLRLARGSAVADCRGGRAGSGVGGVQCEALGFPVFGSRCRPGGWCFLLGTGM